jgi:hypothetical protein
MMRGTIAFAAFVIVLKATRLAKTDSDVPKRTMMRAKQANGSLI